MLGLLSAAGFHLVCPTANTGWILSLLPERPQRVTQTQREGIELVLPGVPTCALLPLGWEEHGDMLQSGARRAQPAHHGQQAQSHAEGGCMFLGRGMKAKHLLRVDAQGLHQELVPRTVDEPAGLNH